MALILLNLEIESLDSFHSRMHVSTGLTKDTKRKKHNDDDEVTAEEERSDNSSVAFTIYHVLCCLGEVVVSL